MVHGPKHSAINLAARVHWTLACPKELALCHKLHKAHGPGELLARKHFPFSLRRIVALFNRTRPKGQENYLQASISSFRYGELSRNKTSCFGALCQSHMFSKHASVLLLLRQLSISVKSVPMGYNMCSACATHIVLSMTEGRNLALAYEASSQSQTIFLTKIKFPAMHRDLTQHAITAFECNTLKTHSLNVLLSHATGTYALFECTTFARHWHLTNTELSGEETPQTSPTIRSSHTTYFE